MMTNVICVFVLLGCSFGQVVPENKPQSSELISPALISRAGWTMSWQLNLPLKSQETIDRMIAFDEYLYVLTNSNILFCIDRSAGKMRFVTPLARPGLPICDPIMYEKNLLFMVGNELVIVDPWAGAIVERSRFEQIGNTYECGLAMNKDYVYFTSSDGRLYAYAPYVYTPIVSARNAKKDSEQGTEEESVTAGYWRVFSATADNNSPIISLAALDDRVLFATHAGNVVAIAPDKPEKYWQFDTTGTIEADLVVSDGMVYVGSHDTKLYKLNIENGRLAWSSPFHAGDRIRKPVVVGQKLVYLTADRTGVYGIDKETGQAVWQIPEGVGVLTETADRSFVFSRPGLLNVMDNAAGKKLYSVNFSKVRYFATIMHEPRMYVADEKGRLAEITVK